MYYLAQAGSSLQAVQTDGTIVSLTLPSGVTIDATKKGIFSILGQSLVFSYASSINLLIDPTSLTVWPLGLLPPMAAPTLAAGSSTGLTGAYRVKVSYAIKDAQGTVISESPLSGRSLPVTLANQDLSITNIPISTDALVTTRRVYRTVSGGTVYFLAFDIDDNTTTAALSAIADAALAILPEDSGLGIPPGTVPGTRLRLITTWKNRLWGIGDDPTELDIIRYSQDLQPYAWPEDNQLLATPKGEDQFGATGFIVRRDELGVCKRSRILKIVGKDFDPIDGDAQVIGVAEGIGCISAATIVVVRDIGYFLGLDGVYTFGPDGVTKISGDKVDPWFQTDTYFNRTLFSSAYGGYNPKNDSYDLHLAAAGSSNIDRWVSFDIRRQQWTGIHLTSKFTPTARGLLRDAGGAGLPAIGSSDGYLYKMNQAGASDQSTAIAISWATKYFSGNAPDIDHFWDQPTVMNQIQGVAATPVVVTPIVGDLSSAAGTAQNISQRVDRSRLARFGAGRLLQLTFTHATDAEDVMLYAMEIPFNEIGRR